MAEPLIKIRKDDVPIIPKERPLVLAHAQARKHDPLMLALLGVSGIVQEAFLFRFDPVSLPGEFIAISDANEHRLGTQLDPV